MLLRHAPTPLAFVSLSEEWYQAEPIQSCTRHWNNCQGVSCKRQLLQQKTKRKEKKVAHITFLFCSDCRAFFMRSFILRLSNGCVLEAKQVQCFTCELDEKMTVLVLSILSH